MLSRAAIVNHFWRTVFVVFALLVSALIGIEIMRLDVRFAIMVQDVTRHGLGIFTTVNGYEYTDYPSLYLLPAWLTTFGGHAMCAALLALPSLFFTALLIGLVLKIGESIASWVGIVSAGLMLSSVGFLDLILGFAIDLPVALAAGIMLYYLQQHAPLKKLAGVFALLSFTVFFIRGPLGFMVLAAAAGGALLLEKRWKELGATVLSGFVTLLAASGVAYLLIHLQGGETLWKLFLKWQFSARVEAVGDNEYFYYFLNGLPTLSPVGLGAIAGILLLRKKSLQAPAIGWIGFVLFPMLLLSIPGCKHLRYMLLAVPALALLTGYGIVCGNWPEALKKWGIWLLKKLGMLLPWLVTIALLLLQATSFFFPFPTPWIHWLAALVLWLVAVKLTGRMEPELGKIFSRMVLATAIVYLLGAYPLTTCFERAKDFTLAVQKEAPGKIYLYSMGPDHDDLKFLLHIPPEKRAEIIYLFNTPRTQSCYDPKMYPCRVLRDELSLIRSNARIVLQERDLKKLTEEIEKTGSNLEIREVVTGTLGHRKCVAVQLRKATENHQEMQK